MKTYNSITGIRAFYLCLLFFSSSLFASVDVFFNQDDRAYFKDPLRKEWRQGHNFQEIIIKELQRAEKSVEVAVQEFRLSEIANALVDLHQRGIDVRVVIESRYNNTIFERLNESGQKKSFQGDGSESLLVTLGNYREDYERELEQIRRREIIDYLWLSEQKNFDPLYDDAIAILRHHNIPLIDDRADGSQGNNLMHHKFVIIDGKKLILTSANFTVHDFFGIPNSETRLGNANALLVIEDQSLSDIFLEEFNIMYGDSRKGPRFGTAKPYRGVQAAQIQNSQIKVQFAPTWRSLGYERSSGGLIQRTIKAARESVHSALFVFSDQEISDSLKTVKKERGVDLSVMVDRLFAFRYYSKAMDLLGLVLPDHECRLFRGVNPWTPPAQRVGAPNLSGDKLHHKFAVVDNQKVIFGSQNWTSSGNFNNDEFLVIIDDARIAQEFSREVMRLKYFAEWGALPWVYERIEERQAACNL